VGEEAQCSPSLFCASGIQADRNVRCEQNWYTWSDAPSSSEPIGTLYSDFLERLNGLNTGEGTPCFAGYCDWRIPTIGELRSIISAPYPGCSSGPCIDPIFGRRWRTTTGIIGRPARGELSDEGRMLQVWIADFSDGSVGGSNKYSGNLARAVRSAR